MEVDWEVEIGGGAPVIDACWPGFIDLRAHPDRVHEISEVSAFPPLATLLLTLNAINSPFWTSKCDLWEPEPTQLAAYIDLLPRERRVFDHWQQAEAFCRDFVARLAPIALPDLSPECSINLVIRQAVADEAEGFAITAYLSTRAVGQNDAAAALATVMAVFADALPPALPPVIAGSKLQ